VEKKLSKDERCASEGTITTRVEQKQAAATVYGKYFDGCLAFAAAKRSDYIVADAAFVGRGTDCKPGRNVSVCPGDWPKQRFRCPHISMSGGDRRVTHGRRFWDGADARDFCRLADRFDGMAAAGAESARVSIIIILTYLVGISGVNHIIAGSTTMFFLVVTKSISPGTCITQLFFATCWAM